MRSRESTVTTAACVSHRRSFAIWSLSSLHSFCLFHRHNNTFNKTPVALKVSRDLVWNTLDDGIPFLPHGPPTASHRRLLAWYPRTPTSLLLWFSIRLYSSRPRGDISAGDDSEGSSEPGIVDRGVGGAPWEKGPGQKVPGRDRERRSDARRAHGPLSGAGRRPGAWGPTVRWDRASGPQWRGGAVRLGKGSLWKSSPFLFSLKLPCGLSTRRGQKRGIKLACEEKKKIGWQRTSLCVAERRGRPYRGCGQVPALTKPSSPPRRPAAPNRDSAPARGLHAHPPPRRASPAPPPVLPRTAH